MLTIDVIIPSFRAQKKYLLPILNLSRPENTIVRFYLIIDNPDINPDKDILELIDNDTVNLIVNPKNLGASRTRNVGIEAGHGEWILFLDDDIRVPSDLLGTYKKAILNFNNEIGFIGLVNLPETTTEFTKAISASGSAGIFSVARETDYFAWGATANIILKRSALGSVRFSEAYPKSGGGEDVDFFLRVRKANNYKNLKTLKEAEVWHPWWDEGEVNFMRTYRYGKGTGYLIRLNPEYTRYDLPSTPEILFFSILIAVAGFMLDTDWGMLAFYFIFGTIAIDITANLINTLRKKGRTSVPTLTYMIIMKFSYDFGILSTNVSKGFFNGFLKRFNYNGSRKKDHFLRFNTYKIVKTILTILLLTYLLVNYFNIL